jgi:fucose 4-O-acetylase-like acetyltransferase
VGWVDVAKGIGILLVVYGHVARGLVDAGIQPRQGVPVATTSLIYAFHMPLFFLLAGLWVPRAAARPLRRFFAEKTGTILYPYVLWSIIQLGANLAMARFTNAAPEPFRILEILVRPYAQFWFLYVLFIDLSLAVLVLRLPKGGVICLFLGIILYVAHPLMESSAWRPAAQVASTFVYVAAGAAVSPWLARPSGQTGCRWCRWAVTVVAFCLLTLSVLGAGELTEMLAPVAAALGILAVVSTAQALRGTAIGEVFHLLGNRSLEIYVAHVMGAAGMRVVLSRIVGISNPWPHLVIDCLAGVIFPLGLFWIARKWRMPWLFTVRVGARAC